MTTKAEDSNHDTIPDLRPPAMIAPEPGGRATSVDGNSVNGARILALGIRSGAMPPNQGDDSLLLFPRPPRATYHRQAVMCGQCQLPALDHGPVWFVTQMLDVDPEGVPLVATPGKERLVSVKAMPRILDTGELLVKQGAPPPMGARAGSDPPAMLPGTVLFFPALWGSTRLFLGVVTGASSPEGDPALGLVARLSVQLMTMTATASLEQRTLLGWRLWMWHWCNGRFEQI